MRAARAHPPCGSLSKITLDGPDRDDGGFGDRAVWLETTIGGAGRLAGDLTPAGAAALTVVLDALSGTAGPEDTRTLLQRRHDALEEACQRLIRSSRFAIFALVMPLGFMPTSERRIRRYPGVRGAGR